MSTDDRVLPALDPRAYDPLRGEWIAQRYASGEPGTGLSDLHRADPDAVPSPMVIRRWRSTFPAFDQLMTEAARERAEALVEAALPIADDANRNAAQAKNAIAVRFRMAEALAPEIFGSGAKAKSPGEEDVMRLAGRLTDAQLLRIMAGEDVRAVLLNDTPPPPLPPAAARPGLSGGNEVIPPARTFHVLEASAIEPPGVPRKTSAEYEKSAETSG
jgi:hypothetical protein